MGMPYVVYAARDLNPDFPAIFEARPLGHRTLGLSAPSPSVGRAHFMSCALTASEYEFVEEATTDWLSSGPLLRPGHAKTCCYELVDYVVLTA